MTIEISDDAYKAAVRKAVIELAKQMVKDTLQILGIQIQQVPVREISICTNSLDKPGCGAQR